MLPQRSYPVSRFLSIFLFVETIVDLGWFISQISTPPTAPVYVPCHIDCQQTITEGCHHVRNRKEREKQLVASSLSASTAVGKCIRKEDNCQWTVSKYTQREKGLIHLFPPHHLSLNIERGSRVCVFWLDPFSYIHIGIQASLSYMLLVSPFSFFILLYSISSSLVVGWFISCGASSITRCSQLNLAFKQQLPQKILRRIGCCNIQQPKRGESHGERLFLLFG